MLGSYVPVRLLDLPNIASGDTLPLRVNSSKCTLSLREGRLLGHVKVTRQRRSCSTAIRCSGARLGSHHSKAGDLGQGVGGQPGRMRCYNVLPRASSSAE